MLKIRRPTGRLIFNMGIPIPGKTVFYIETGPWLLRQLKKFRGIPPGLQSTMLAKIGKSYSPLSETILFGLLGTNLREIRIKIWRFHHSDVMRGAMASQITSLTNVYSTVIRAQIRTHQSSASLAFVRGIHWWPVNSPHKRPVIRKMFPFDDVIMEIAYVMALMLTAIGSNFLFHYDKMK